MATTASANRSNLIVVSYNFHGFNQGSHGVKDMIATLMPDVIMVQEHWLTPDCLCKLNDISTSYFTFGSSAMIDCISAGPLRGRPFGGTAVMVNKKFASITTNLVTSDRFTVVKIDNWLLISVYMPCVGTDDRTLLYYDILSELDSLIAVHSDCHCIIGGDFNTDLDCNVNTSVAVNNFISNNSLYRCDVLFPLSSRNTFVNESTHAASAIDYFLTSSADKAIAFNILDIDLNLSDHLPIMIVCATVIKSERLHRPKSQDGSADVAHLRWDHAPLALYYEYTRQSLQPVLEALNDIVDNLPVCDIELTIAGIDSVYNRVVECLRSCADLLIPKHRKNFYKFWWNQELDALKDKALASCRAWKNAGKPRHGTLFSEYKKDKLLYKKRIREEKASEISCYTNDLHEALLRKNGHDFWKTWKSKLEKKNKTSYITQVDGVTDCEAIVQSFANFFQSNCKPFNNARNSELKLQYDTARAQYCGSPAAEAEEFDVELIGSLVYSMKNGKAAGLDELSCEHIKFSHPIVVSILSKLFNLFIKTGHIPASFGAIVTQCRSQNVVLKHVACQSMILEEFLSVQSSRNYLRWLFWIDIPITSKHLITSSVLKSI